MNNLLMWERNGEVEIGYEFSEACFLSSENYYTTKSAITNLRPAKVVDADAVVIDKSDFEDLDTILAYAQNNKEGIKTYSPAFDLIERLVEAINPTPPITEPKNFGAIVEADAGKFGNNLSGRRMWVYDGKIWSSESFFRIWSDLINPVIISEGVKE